MKVNLAGVLKTFEGKAFTEEYLDSNDKKQERDLTVFNAIRNAVLTVMEEQKSGIDKYQSYALAKKLVEGENELSAEDISKIKKHVGFCWNPLVVGQIWDLLEGQKEEKKVD